MAIFYSDLIMKRTVVRNTGMNDAVESATAAIRIPAGTTITAGDTLRFMRCDWGVVPTRATLTVSGALDSNTPTLAGTLGTIQIAPGKLYAGTNASGVAQTYDVATATTNVSPATSAASLVAASVINGTLQAGGIITVAETPSATEKFASGLGNGFTGPVEVALTCTVTSDGATAAERYVTLTLEFARIHDVEGAIQVDRGGY